MTWPRAALFSLSDKTGVIDFARALASRGTRILASGGTAQHLAQAGVAVTPIEDWTRTPELAGGRVKTLHPHVHAPILARRNDPADLAALAERGIEPIDLVAVTLYPFEERAAALDASGAVEEIDIGGVALLRASAKNHQSVIAIHDPAEYPEVLRALEGGGLAPEHRRRLALGVFARTARYDAAIAADLARRAGESTPPVHVLALERVRALRYGENPHQPAALYARAGDPAALHAEREGKELSYNNLLDVHAAVSLCGAFEAPACVIVKHNEPCGVATASTLAGAYRAAFGSDELSAFGGVIAFNRSLDAETARSVAGQFVECVTAPEIEPEAEQALASKKNLRLLKIGPKEVASSDPWSLRMVGPWGLLQGQSSDAEPPWRTATRREPTPAEAEGMRFAWIVAAAARSNAATIARGQRLLGVGSGQTSRVDAVEVALMKARRAGHDLKGAVLASDGFFPFADGVEHAADAGITAVVQPGGSQRDADVVAACDARGIAMVFTGRRTFRH